MLIILGGAFAIAATIFGAMYYKQIVDVRDLKERRERAAKRTAFTHQDTGAQADKRKPGFGNRGPG